MSLIFICFFELIIDKEAPRKPNKISPLTGLDSGIVWLFKINSPVISAFSLSSQVQAQVTNVNQLRDVSPSDWSFEALKTSNTDASITGELILNSQTIPESSPVNGLILLGCLGASLSIINSKKQMNIKDK